MKYNPNDRIDPEAWLALDESERLEAVRAYHRRQKIVLPNETIHASIHVVVENQIALGDEYSASAVLSRLMSEGLDRHDAVHAIGSVLAEQLFKALQAKADETDLNAEYVNRLSQLTAESWRKQYSQTD